MQLPYMTTLRWMRIPGDTLFAIGAVAIIAFVFGAGRRAPREVHAKPLRRADIVASAEE
jgi:nitric oxide reductase large subunit